MNAHLLGLRVRLNEAQRRYDWLGMVNIVGMSHEDRVKLDVDFNLADRALQKAKREYDKALDAFCEGSAG